MEPSNVITVAVNLSGLDQSASASVSAVTRQMVVGTSVIQGPKGDDGADGPQGPTGAPGQGIPTGGTTNQVLTKSSGTDYATVWSTPSGGGGGISRTIVSTSGNVTAGSTAATDYLYVITGAHTVTLPTAVGNTNLYILKNSHSANVSLAFTSSQTADGGGITLAPDESVSLLSNNSNWRII